MPTNTSKPDPSVSHAVTPLLSVLMPTYNGEKFLRPAISSILSQTFRHFELIVVNDASTDGTSQFLAEINDSRLVVVNNQHNLGIAGATNAGLALAKGKYVALQDHDDISLPRRFEAQVRFLDSHPNVAAVGTAALLIDAQGSVLERYIQPTDDLNLKWGLLYGCCFHHTSLMVKHGVILSEGGYRDDPSFPFAPDYDFFSRIGSRYLLANLPEPLVLWRRHHSNTSFSNAQQQKRSEIFISFRNVCSLLEDSDHAAGKRLQDFLGLRAFLLTDAGKFPDLPPRQVIAGVRFLSDIETAFYRKYGFTKSAVLRHRMEFNWKSGKHAVALGLRAPWEWRFRISVLRLGLHRLRLAFWAALLTPWSRKNPVHTEAYT